MTRVGSALLFLFVATTTTGCMSDAVRSSLCHRGWTVAHPTMTTDEIVIGQEAHVRAVSEGAKGGLGTSQTYAE